MIKKSTVDSGGGTVAGGSYRLSGTVGQADASDLTGGSYVLTGGFWSPAAGTCLSVADPCSAEPNATRKNRYLSFVGGNPGANTAIRVTITSMPAPFGSFVGDQWWVGPPVAVTESASGTGPTPLPASNMARLRCTQHCMDWSTMGLVHVYDDEIIPGATYDVQAIDCGCDASNPSSYSAPLSVQSSARCGDIVAPFGVVDFADIGQVVDKFRNLPTAVIKARADLTGNVPDRVIDFFDIGKVVDGFRGLPCVWNGPCLCPGPYP